MKFRIISLFSVLVLLLSGLAFAAPGQAGAPTAEAASAVAAKPKKKDKYRPAKGAKFNIPVGNAAQRLRIERHIIQAIKHTKKHEYIQIAAYSLDRMPVAWALAAARKRGVRVQLLLNDHQVTRAQRYLRGVLGQNRKKKSFIWECRAGCRSQRTEYNNLHSKFYLFSKTGRAHKVVMLGSQNMTMNAVRWQWNDLWTSRGNAALYDGYNALFNDMKNDYDTRQATYSFCGAVVTTCNPDTSETYHQVFPKVGGVDPVKRLLDDVTCVYNTADGTRRTKIYVSMHTMRGKRGERLALDIRQKFAQGCDVRVLFGLMGFYVKQKLTTGTARGRMPLRSTGFDINADEVVERYTHQKYAVIDGMYRGRVGGTVVTGSSNWSSLGLPQDELMVEIRDKPKVTKQYLRNFNLMWRPRYSRNAYTTTYAIYESYFMADGIPVPTLKRVPVTTVRQENLRPGPTWEND